MSVWTHVHGTIIVPKSAHISLKKAIETYFGNHECGKPSIEEFRTTREKQYFDVSFSFSLEGRDASKLIAEFVDAYGDCQMDLNAEVRFIS